MNLLFNDRPMHEELDRRIAAVRAKIAQLTSVELANPDLAMQLRKAYELTDLVLRPATTEPREAPSGGIVIDVTVPFRGSAALLACQPSQWTFNPPQGAVQCTAKPGPDGIEVGSIVFSSLHHQVDAEAVKRWLGEQIAKLEQYVGWANQDAQGFYSRLANDVPVAIEQRQTKLDEIERLRRDLC